MMNRESVLTPVDGRPGYCTYCGMPLEDGRAAAERYGEPFCSDAHAKQFTEGVRAARMKEAAVRENTSAACAMSGDRTWTGRLKRAACWGAPLLLLLAIPLFWSGNAVAAAGGSLLSVLAALACPIGMFFMMRAMMPGRREKRDE